MNRRIHLACLALLGTAGVANAQLGVASTFNPSNSGGLCGLASAQDAQIVWVYDCSAGTVDQYLADGTFVSSIPRPGESTNDVDLEVTRESMNLGGTQIPAGTLLFINGESGPAEVYALDSAGTVIATLNVAWGNSHIVGGAYHAVRDTMFFVQDRNGGGQANQIAEVNPETGAVLNTFSTIASGFDVNYGDMDISPANGNLFVVSSNESSIAEFTPVGVLVQTYPLPAGVNGLSGIGMNDSSNDGWVAETGGEVHRLVGFPGAACLADWNQDFILNTSDFISYLNDFNSVMGGGSFTHRDPDIAVPFGTLNTSDFVAYLNHFGAGCDP